VCFLKNVLPQKGHPPPPQPPWLSKQKKNERQPYRVFEIPVTEIPERIFDV
jgi:hypothetical protein